MVKEAVAETSPWEAVRIEAIAGETIISDEVLAAITGVAVKEVAGVHTLGTSSIRSTISERVGGAPRHARGVSVEAGKKEAILYLQVNVVYGYSIPKIATEVRLRVAERILDLAGLVTKEINIHVVGIEFEGKKEHRVE